MLTVAGTEPGALLHIFINTDHTEGQITNINDQQYLDVSYKKVIVFREATVIANTNAAK